MGFRFVETRGRTLEEINEIFHAPYPKGKSIEEHVVVISEATIARQWAMQTDFELEPIPTTEPNASLDAR